MNAIGTQLLDLILMTEPTKFDCVQLLPRPGRRAEVIALRLEEPVKNTRFSMIM